MPGGTTYMFDDREEVLAYHGPLIHEAEVKERVEKDAPDGRKLKLYKLHYSGWSTHWDEWVPESRVLKMSDDNRAAQKERVKEFQRAHKRKRTEVAAVAAAAAAAGTASAAVAAKKPKANGSGPVDESLVAEVKDMLRLPHGAKLKLIEDWEHITREKKLVELPSSPNVAQLLADFTALKARKTSHERLYAEVQEGVCSYFNQALPTILLYKYERRQHRDLKERFDDMTQCYGAEHLLRLFVKFPELLSRCNMQREHLTVLLTKLQELLKFLLANKGKYFASEYKAPNNDYLEWWSSEEKQ